MKEIDDELFFEEVSDFEPPVFILFSTSSCKPCAQYKPVIESVAQRFTQFSFFTCKADDRHCARLAGHANVRSVPTLVEFKNGVVQRQLTGARSASVVEDWLRTR